ncbi:Forkhead box protein fkh-4 [Caenorhabditis elegans]|uniref:Forkhead box protein fkh-4 n=1 Tax=Caenorhabditis elegans TaxID=6239 RepID=FKH4_CAEEL|nr:Forkhead box protein fkh-4 [Caenorhabditis elegans]O17617.2 RecName: Full=Forkhead box protein fkh-4 [Caenorhabditis elegans]CAB07323.2 Forkhead box protein fkh-4 [Caenorhabditis elegans]|eukprot:NP_510238.2 ForKHead transcription factor family [Caenorhabditis elegans]
MQSNDENIYFPANQYVNAGQYSPLQQSFSQNSQYDLFDGFAEFGFLEQVPATNMYSGSQSTQMEQNYLPNVNNSTRKRKAPGQNEQATVKRRQIGIEKWRLPSRSVVQPSADISDLRRPPISYVALCALACRNAPDMKITPAGVYAFVLHHWRYYRYANENWKNSVRHQLSSKEHFDEETFQPDPSNPTVRRKFYIVKNPNMIRQNLISDADFDFFRKDSRGIEFYQKMFAGQIGLPRSLFYQIIGNGIPFLAGPENSSMFYQLLGMGKVVGYLETRYFREHYRSEHAATEPKYEEDYANFTEKIPSNAENLMSYGAATERNFQKFDFTDEEIELFHLNISSYHSVQKTCKECNLPNWCTPSVGDVETYVFGRQVPMPVNTPVILQQFETVAEQEGIRNNPLEERKTTEDPRDISILEALA